jgi:hypothetical protein
MEVNGQIHAPAALSPGKEAPVFIGWKVEWVPESSERCGLEKKFLAPAGNPTPVVQRVPRRYTY